MFIYELFEGGKEYKCTCLPNDKDPDCPKHGLEPMDVGDALDEQDVAEGMAGKVVFSGTGANGGTYEIIQSGPTDFMIHANGRHIDTYGSLQRAMSVLKNEVPGLQQGVAEGKMAELDMDLEDPEISDRQFEKMYGMTRKEARELFSKTNMWDFPQVRDPNKPLHEQGVAEGKSLGLHYPTNNEAKQRLDPKCWTGYKKQGTKMKGGVRVNNCVPIEEENKGLYYNVNKRKKAGTSRDADHPKAPTAQAWKDAAKTAKK